jgi:hypothetical protein
MFLAGFNKKNCREPPTVPFQKKQIGKGLSDSFHSPNRVTGIKRIKNKERHHPQCNESSSWAKLVKQWILKGD